MDVPVHYGDGVLTLRIPEGNLARVIRPWAGGSEGANAERIAACLSGREAARFRKAAAGQRVAVLLPDASRDLPFEDLLPAVLAKMDGCVSCRLLVCTGTHSPRSPHNRELVDRLAALAAAAPVPCRVDIHDCAAPDLRAVGETSRGTPLLVNPLVEDADVFLVLSDVKPHYFAGYSNPIKNFVPGACGFATAERNHSLALDDRSRFGRHPWQSDPNRRDNPLAADQLEGMERILAGRPVFALAMLSTGRSIHWLDFGPAEPTCRRAFDETDRRNSFTVEPAERLIVSPGGLPNDVDLYIAQRALELTKAAVRDGGEVLFLAACPRGVGEPHTREEFYDRMTLPMDEILRGIQREYRLFSHKPYRFAQLIGRLRNLWVYSQIADETLLRAHLQPAGDPQAVVDRWLAEEPGAHITVVDGANKLALYPA